MSLRAWMAAALAAAVFVSAVALVQAKYQNRTLFERRQQLMQERDELRVDWGRLRLELSALVMHGRIERIARQRLDMTMPEAADVVVIRDE